MPARSRSRRTTRGRSQRTSDRAALVRLALFALVATVLVSTVPPLRAAFDGLRTTLLVAMEVSRATDAGRVAVARYALRYDISYELASAIRNAATREGIDPDLAFRLVRVESEFKERAVSPVGALGLTQLMPATAAEMQPGITREEIFDRDTNLRLGFKYLRWLLRAYDGDVDNALHAYNRGPGTVDRIRARGGDPANGYASKVRTAGRGEAYRGSGLWSGSPAGASLLDGLAP